MNGFDEKLGDLKDNIQDIDKWAKLMGLPADLLIKAMKSMGFEDEHQAMKEIEYALKTMPAMVVGILNANTIDEKIELFLEGIDEIRGSGLNPINQVGMILELIRPIQLVMDKIQPLIGKLNIPDGDPK